MTEHFNISRLETRELKFTNQPGALFRVQFTRGSRQLVYANQGLVGKRPKRGP